MSWNHPVLDRIREAMETGELESPEQLHGKPLDLRDYFATPEPLRMGYSVLKSGGFTPVEVDLLRQIRALEKTTQEEVDPEKRSAMHLELAALHARLNAKPVLLQRRSETEEHD